LGVNRLPVQFAWPDASLLRLEMLVQFLTSFYTRSLDNLADVVIQALSFIRVARYRIGPKY
jgi:hypothetical protein